MSGTNKTFLVGDVHGCSSLLVLMLRFIEDFSMNGGFRPKVTFLGDIVDRGTDSKSALDIVLKTIRTWKGSRTLLGNHDEMFLTAVASRTMDNYSRHWFNKCGGRETCQSFTDEQFFPLACRNILDQAEDQMTMLSEAELLVREGPFVVCHAGINGWLPLDQQHRDDLLWIREGFLDRVDPFMPPVIHGHTIMESHLPVVTENRISLDTGAFLSGRLTCMLLDHDERRLRFFQTRNDLVTEVDPILENRGKGSVFDRIPALYGG